MIEPVRATSADSEALALIGAASFLETYAGLLPGPALVAHCRQHHSATSWRSLLAAPGAACWLAQAERGAPIGYALLTQPDIAGLQPGDAELRRIYTLSRFQGAGLGQALLDAVISEARHNGASRLVLGVFQHNARARAFYQKCGFEPIATRIFMVGGLPCDDLVLALTLS